MTAEQQTIFANDHYQIRPLVESHAAELHTAVRASLAELSAWLPWCTEDYNFADSEQFLSRGKLNWDSGIEYEFGVFNLATGDLLGVVGIHGIRRAENCANIGYWTRTGSTGQGVATLAVRAASIFGFQKLGLACIEILVQPTNHASRRVAEKLGACFEEIARDKIIFRGEPRAAAVYSLRPGDIRG
jgi:ribosomal-protein-serine acetyltransferase